MLGQRQLALFALNHVIVIIAMRCWCTVLRPDGTPNSAYPNGLLIADLLLLKLIGLDSSSQDCRGLEPSSSLTKKFPTLNGSDEASCPLVIQACQAHLRSQLEVCDGARLAIASYPQLVA